MRGVVEINGEKVEMLSTASSPYRFRQVFHEDFLLKSRKFATSEDEEESITEAIDVFIKMGFIMAMQASGADMAKLDYDAFLKWLDKYESNGLMQAVDDIAEIYKGQEKQTSVPKE